MNKTQRALLTALALAGTSAAMAQSSVTLYGRVNTTVEHQKSGNANVTGMFNNASRWGIRGTEDLGGGLKAGFALESGFASDTGVVAGPFFGRQSEVNLGSSSLGMLRMGNFISESYYATADYISMHNHDTGSSADMLYTYLMRDTNKVAYRLPAFGGFTAEGAVSMHEGVARSNAYDVALNYGAGPLGLGLGYTKNQGAAGVFGAAGLRDAQQLGLRASYTTGPVTLGAYYQYVTSDSVDGSLAPDAKRHAVRLAAMYTMGASEFHANLGRAEKIKLSGAGNAAGTAANQWTLGYNYNLSKRTKVYGYYTKLNNGANISYLPGGKVGEDFSSFAVGVRHNF